ncbi:MAG: FAD-dependent oxidoreductase, partial [Cyanobacteria bacterium J06635_13]
MFDCIVVGAGPAGGSAAYHLAKAGHSVLVLDKANFPRDKSCGGGVSPAIAQWFDFDFAPVVQNHVSQVKYTFKMGDSAEVDLEGVTPLLNSAPLSVACSIKKLSNCDRCTIHIGVT